MATESTRASGSPPAAGRAETARSGDAEASADWEELRASPEFHRLVAARVRFVVPATIFFLVFYMLLPLGIAFAPGLMKTNVAGHINVAYVFALCQFLMTWILTYAYIKRADSTFDRLAAAVRRLAGQKGVAA